MCYDLEAARCDGGKKTRRTQKSGWPDQKDQDEKCWPREDRKGSLCSFMQSWVYQSYRETRRQENHILEDLIYLCSSCFQRKHFQFYKVHMSEAHGTSRSNQGHIKDLSQQPLEITGSVSVSLCRKTSWQTDVHFLSEYQQIQCFKVQHWTQKQGAESLRHSQRANLLIYPLVTVPKDVSSQPEHQHSPH